MQNIKHINNLSIIMNVVLGVISIPYIFLSPLLLMGTDGFYGSSELYQDLTIAAIYILISVNVFILIAIILSVRFRKKGHIYRSFFVNFIPIAVFIFGVVLAYIAEGYR